MTADYWMFEVYTPSGDFEKLYDELDEGCAEVLIEPKKGFGSELTRFLDDIGADYSESGLRTVKAELDKDEVKVIADSYLTDTLEPNSTDVMAFENEIRANIV